MAKLAAFWNRDAKLQQRPKYNVSTQINYYTNKETEKHIKNLISRCGNA